MALDNLDTSALSALRSSEQQNLLDEIDSLRLQGLSEFVFLPQIVAFPFPRNDTLCTRFATEVILREATSTEAAVSIVPGQDVSDADREKLLLFKETLQGLEELPGLIERAKSEMGITPTGNAFSRSILRLEISGPQKPKLTVVDLPGLIHSDSKQQSPADVDLISKLVRSYMKNPRSVILAVVSAKNDYANQIILKRAREVDREGLRTLGLITKPDTLHPGSDSEADFIDLASNDNVQFRLGWHVVKNRDYDSRNSSAEERDRAEAQFFSEGNWNELPRDMVGVDSLRHRLSNILIEQIKRYLPSLMDDIKSNINECEKKLAKLGDSRSTAEEQRLFLLKVSQSFQTICKAAVDGSYDDTFFGDPSSVGEYSKRLRAVVQNLNLDFSEVMRKEGHHRMIDDEATSNEPVDQVPGDLRQIVMGRTEAIEWVRKRLVRGRGRELPGSFNPLLVGELFRDQSMRWEKIAREHVEEVWIASKSFLERLLENITDDGTFRALFTLWIDPNTNERFDKANQTLDRLLVDRERHPITYNHYYTEVLQRIMEQRQTKDVADKIKHYLGVSSDSNAVYLKNFNLDTTKLANSLSAQPERDMDEFACSELLDSMQAYYKVALKTFVDNVSIQVVEGVLIGDIWSILSPTDVGQMSPTLVTKIAAEHTESQALRQQLGRKLETLRKGMETCRRHSTHGIVGHPLSIKSSPAQAQGKTHDNTESEDSESEIPEVSTPMQSA